MKKIARVFTLLLAAIVLHSLSASAQKSKDITQSYYGAFGEKPTQAEMDYWMGQPDVPVTKRLENHRAYMKANAAYADKAIFQSYLYEFGRKPSKGETDYWRPQNLLFMELIDRHAAYLKTSDKEWNETVARAYISTANGRAPSMNELAIWTKKPRTDFFTLSDQMKAAGIR